MWPLRVISGVFVVSQLLVTGSIGIDSVDAPTGSCRDCLGGSAAYFALAARTLCPVRLVGAVGDDFPDEFLDVLKSRNIDIAGLEVRQGSKTFRWHGKYSDDMNDRTTLDVKLNVLVERGPVVPDTFRDSEYVFLANNPPELQMSLLDALDSPKLVVCDTMDLYIENSRDGLLELLKRVDGLIINDSEARQLTGETNLLTAIRAIHKMGPRHLVVKKGEHGCILCTGRQMLVLPAFLTEKVVDPTGAGDSFAGGLMGYLASINADRDDEDAWRTGLIYGTVAASFTIQSFSVDGLIGLDEEKMKRRIEELNSMIKP